MTERRRRSDSPRTGVRVPPHPSAQPGAPLTVRIVKIGGRAQADPRLANAIVAAASVPGARIVVVHGGGDAVTELQRSRGIEPTFVTGRRVTSVDDLDAVRMVLSGTVNKRLTALLQLEGARAVGISGEDGGLLSARVTDPALGRVGADVFADASLLAHLLNGGWLPVVSPLARDRDSSTGAGLNVNGDDAAAALAAGIGADELLFVADVEGVLDEGRVRRLLEPTDVQAIIARGVAVGGMRAKLEAALAALRNGVRRVRIASIDGISNTTVGTQVALPSTAPRANA